MRDKPLAEEFSDATAARCWSHGVPRIGEQLSNPGDSKPDRIAARLRVHARPNFACSPSRS
jgi:hypothetical protein